MDTQMYSLGDRRQTDADTSGFYLLGGLAGKTEYTKTSFIVSVVSVVPVAGGGTQPISFVVPRTAPNNISFFP